MKRWMRVLFVLAMLVLTCVSMVLPAFAQEAAKLSLPVTVKVSGTKPKPDEDYEIVLQANDKAFPMPKGSTNGIYTMTITGADTDKFPAISFNHVGKFTYTIHQKAGTNKNGTYDDTVYNLTVTATNTSDYESFELTVVLETKDSEEKLEDVVFTNKYKAESTSVKTGDESNPMLYVGLVFVGLAMFLVLFLTRRKKEYEE